MRWSRKLWLIPCGVLLLAPGTPPVTATQAARSGRFSPVVPLAPGWLTPWTRRVQLTIDADSLPATTTMRDFPVALTLGPAQRFIFDQAKADGSDLVVTKADGTTQLPREVVRFDPVSGNAEMWFRADSLSTDRNQFYLYYGNPNASLPRADGTVWNQRYVAAYHFSEDPADSLLEDFSTRHNDATTGYRSIWSSSDVTPGVVGQAWVFDGVTHFIDADAISTSDSSFVISAWALLTTNTTDFAFQANPGFWHVSFQINETHHQPHYAIDRPLRDLRWNPKPLPLDGRFHNFTWVFDGVADTILFYFDGVQQLTTPSRLDSSVSHFYTGHPINPTGTDGVGVAGPMSLNTFDIVNGSVDEFRVVEGTLPGEWILTEYRNQRNLESFIAVGPEETSDSSPVRLLEFTAARDGDRTVLRWSVDSGAAEGGDFLIFRETGGERLQIATEPVSGATVYSIVDARAPSGAVLYRIAERDPSGEIFWLGSADLTAVESGPLRLELPNPIRGEADFWFSTSRTGAIRLQVFDVSGREVDRILDEIRPAGRYAMRWDPRTPDGTLLRPGLYFVRLQAADGMLTRKLLLIR